MIGSAGARGRSLLTTAVSTTRGRLVVLVAAILTPLALFAFLLFLKLSDTERVRYSADAIASAQQLSGGVDRELEALTAALEVMAVSPSLAPGGDLEEFRRQAEQVLRTRGYSVVLRDRRHQVLVSTQIPGGASLPKGLALDQLEADRMVFETGKRVISDLFESAPERRKLVVVATPVFRGSEVVYSLSIALDPDHLSQILAEAARPGWVISLVDRNDRIIASSRNDPAFVGREATADLRAQTRAKSGTWTGTTLEGTRVLGAYARSPISDWRVTVGVPLATIAAPLQRITLISAVSGLLMALLALGFARKLALTISRPIALLARAAEGLGGGETMPKVQTGLAEVDEVGAALAQAQATVGAREAALQASEERFRAAVRAVEGWIWTNDSAGRMSGEQASWSALTGQVAEEYEGFGWARAVHPDDATATVAAWQAAVRERRTFVFEHRVRRADGVYRRFSVRAVPITGADGAVTQWVGVHTDITDDYESRALLAAQEAAVRDLNVTLARRVEQASAERDRIWRISTELMLVAHMSGRVIAVNPAWTQTLGWTETALVGSSFFDLVHADDLEGTAGAVDRLAGGATALGFENRCRHQDGSYRWLSWTAVPEAGVLHAIARDVTAEKAAAEALKRTEEQLRQSQKMEVVGQLTGGIAHDFNNLLTVVTGHLEMARRRLENGAGAEAARLHRHLDSAREGARRAAVLTHRLLAFSRQSPLRPEKVELNAAILGMADLIQRTLGETIEVETRFSETLWPVEADLNQIENAILNLCVNARDAMPSGGQLRIETENRSVGSMSGVVQLGDLTPGDYAVVSVQDTGTGIPLEIQDRVFEPFFTTKPMGKGTGLGLSQVFGFMRQSGGLATIRSAANAGTTVALYFPRATSARVRPDEEEKGEATPAWTVSGELCLVIEDETMVREFTVSALEEAGYRVMAAADGPTGLAILDEHHDIRLVFTDVVLAGTMDGYVVAKEALRRRPGLKVLMTTGYTRETAILAGRMEAEIDIIQKPFTATALVAKISSALASP